MNLRHSLSISFVSSQLMFIINFAGNIILSRILLPHEIGLFSITIALLAIVHAIRDFGIGNYVIKEKHLSEEKLKTVFGLALLVGVSLFIFMQLIKEHIASFYGHQEVGHILGIISINFLIIPLGQPALAVITRNMEFGKVAVIHVASTLAHTCTAILLAYNDYSYASLAYAALVGTACTSFLSLCFNPKHILMLPSIKLIKKIASFGSYTVVANIINNIGDNIVELVVGKIINPTAIGLYSRGFGLARAFEMVILQSLNGVIGAAFGQLHRSSMDMTTLFVNYTRSICFVAWPIYAVLGYFAEEIIVFLYGENWTAAGALLSILVFDRMIICASLASKEVYVGTGAMKTFMQVSTLVHSASFLIILCSAYIGLTAVAYGKIICSVVALTANLYAVKKITNLNITTLFLGLKNSLLSLSVTGLILLTYDQIEVKHDWLLVNIAIVGLLIVCVMACIALTTKDPLGYEIRRACKRLKRSNI